MAIGTLLNKVETVAEELAKLGKPVAEREGVNAAISWTDSARGVVLLEELLLGLVVGVIGIQGLESDRIADVGYKVANNAHVERIPDRAAGEVCGWQCNAAAVNADDVAN